MLQVDTYERQPYNVEAVPVTAANMEEVAEWCGGDIRTMKKPGEAKPKKYIKVRVHRPLAEKQTQAFVGDWVLYAGTGYKVYTDNAFKKSFNKKGK